MNLPKEYILKKLLKTLKENHGFSFGKVSRKKLYEQYSLNEKQKKKYLISEEFNTGPLKKEYSKLLLIQESIKLILECYCNDKNLQHSILGYHVDNYQDYQDYEDNYDYEYQPHNYIDSSNENDGVIYNQYQDTTTQNINYYTLERKIQQLSDKIDELIKKHPEQIIAFESIKSKLNKIFEEPKDWGPKETEFGVELPTTRRERQYNDAIKAAQQRQVLMSTNWDVKLEQARGQLQHFKNIVRNLDNNRNNLNSKLKELEQYIPDEELTKEKKDLINQIQKIEADLRDNYDTIYKIEQQIEKLTKKSIQQAKEKEKLRQLGVDPTTRSGPKEKPTFSGSSLRFDNPNKNRKPRPPKP